MKILIASVAVVSVSPLSPAQNWKEPQADLRTPAQRTEDHRAEMQRLQREANKEVRRQADALEEAERSALLDRIERANNDGERREEERMRRSEAARNSSGNGVREIPSAPEATYTKKEDPTWPTASLGRNQNDPTEFPTFEGFLSARQGQEGIAVVREYRDKVRLHLLRRNEYDDQLVEDIDNQLFAHSQQMGWLTSQDPTAATSMYYLPRTHPDAVDAGFVHRLSLDEDDADAGRAALTYKTLLSQPGRAIYKDAAAYNIALERARLAFNQSCSQQKIVAARRAAVKRGDIPFVIIGTTGRENDFYFGPQMRKCILNDNELAKVYAEYPVLDPCLIGSVRKSLLRSAAFNPP